MAIQTNTASSAFESLVRGQTAASQNTAPRSDMFASMMDRLISEAATRKRDQTQADAAALERRNATADAADRAADRKAAERAQPSRPDPIRAEPAKPRHSSDANAQADARADARAARKEEVQRATGQKEARASDAPHTARAERRETAANHAAAKDGKAAQAHNAQGDGAVTRQASSDATALDETASDVPLEEFDSAIDNGTAEDGAESRPAETADGEAVIRDLTVAVTETTVELVTADQSSTLTDMEAALSLAVSPVAIGKPDGVAEQTPDSMVEATPSVTRTPDSTEDLDAADAAAAAEAALAAAAHQDGKGKTTADGSMKATGKGETDAAKPVSEAIPRMAGTVPAPNAPADGPQTEAIAPHAGAHAQDKVAKTAAEPPPGALPTAELPNDDSVPLPQNLSDLAAAKAKGAGRTGTEGDAGGNAGNRGNQDAGGNAAQMQTPAPQAPVADPAKPAGQSAFLSAAAVAAPDAAPPSDTAAHHTHPVFAGIEGVRTAGGVEAGLTTAQLRPSRGSAGLPMGVQDQVAVHISKNVSEGNDQFTINLRPAELGRIDIKLEIGQDGRVSASVAVEKAQTLELLQRDSRNLERALQEAGLKADSNSLNFSLRGEGGQSFQESGRQGGSGRRGRGLGGGTGEEEDVQAAYTLTLAPGRVDIQA